MSAGGKRRGLASGRRDGASRRCRRSRGRSVDRSGASRRTEGSATRPAPGRASGRARGTAEARRPPPAREEIRKLSSSTRSRSSSHRSSTPLPWTWSSRPGFALSSRTAASTSPSMTWVFCHTGSFSVVEGTYLGRTLMPWETGSPVTRGAASTVPRSPRSCAPEEQCVRALEHRGQERPHFLIGVRGGPTAAVEPAAAVLIGASGALVHPVDAEHHGRHQLHGRRSL